MKPAEITREELWARQQLRADDLDYALWERDRAMLIGAARISRSCTFVVDTFKCAYVFASDNFADRFGYEPRKIAAIERHDDYLESRIHPDDRAQMLALQVQLGQFIYAQPPAERNDYCNHFSYRIRNARGEYVRVVSRHRVLEQDRHGHAWLVMGQIDLSAFQYAAERVACTVENLKTGRMFSPVSTPALLSPR